MPKKSPKNVDALPVVRSRTFYLRSAKNKKLSPPHPIVAQVKVSPEIAEQITKIDSVVIAENPKLITTGSPVAVEKVESPKEITEQIQKALVKAKDSDKYKVIFTEKHRDFFKNSRDRIFSSRTPFEKAIVRFNTSFASELKIKNPKNNEEFNDFISKTPERVLAVPAGECAVIVCGTLIGKKPNMEKIIHAGMVYNKNGKFYVFNPNDDEHCYDDGFYYCYPSDNPVFERPLRARKTDLHIGITGGACFTIAYALKILCETMPFSQFMKFVKTKSLSEIMEKCFEVMES